MSFDAGIRIEQMEGIRDQIVESLTKNGVDKLDEKMLSLLERTANNGVKAAIARQELELRAQSTQSENGYREAATAFIRAQREQGNKRAQAIREGTETSARDSLPELTPRTDLLPGEALQGQFQLGYHVLSGQKDFVPSECLPPPARDDDEEEK